MPGGDRTGPTGMGSMTGRGAGCCAGFAAPGCANPAGLGYGSGRGCGFRRMFYKTGIPGLTRLGYPAHARTDGTAGEREILKRQLELLESQLQQVRKNLSDLEEDKV